MRPLLKSLASRVMIPLTRWYLQKERTYRYHDTTVKVFPGVFHPGLFSSTLFLIQYLADITIHNQTLLELGCGTGLISIESAKRGARVTASDVSARAVSNTQANATTAGVTIGIVQSDLFDNLGERRFDWIIVNPPYYAKKASTESELAWNCGEDFGYFRKLFSQLRHHLNARGKAVMVLTKGCDLEKIFTIARENSLGFKEVQRKRVLFDGEDYLYEYQAGDR